MPALGSQCQIELKCRLPSWWLQRTGESIGVETHTPGVKSGVGRVWVTT